MIYDGHDEANGITVRWYMNGLFTWVVRVRDDLIDPPGRWACYSISPGGDFDLAYARQWAMEGPR